MGLNDVSCISTVDHTSRGVQVQSTLLPEVYTLSALGHKYSHSWTLWCLVIDPDSEMCEDAHEGTWLTVA